jgi:DNA-binding transcriptional LysR family regulator
MHFDVADLRLFSHIAEEHTLTRGAERAALSPAAASARLKSLEAQLGSRLFHRDTRGMTLTPAGETLLRHARVILRQFEHVKSDFLAQASDAHGHFRIFANTTSISEVLPDVLVRFLKERPLVTVDIQERNTREVVRGLLDSAADVGMVAGPVADNGLESQCFSTDRLVLVTPLGHPLGAHRELAFEGSIDHPHVGLRDSTLQRFLTDAADASNRKLSMRVLMGSFDAMCRMIEAGIGIGVLPESAAARHVKAGMRLNVIELSNDWAVRQRRVLYRELEALPACARAFVQVLTSPQGAASPQD